MRVLPDVPDDPLNFSNSGFALKQGEILNADHPARLFRQHAQNRSRIDGRHDLLDVWIRMRLEKIRRRIVLGYHRLLSFSSCQVRLF
jgi:hypothetical protein